MDRAGKNDEQLLHLVLEAYGLAGTRCQLLQSLWNHVYKVETHDGACYSLRICAPEFTQQRWMEDELAFLDFAARVGTISAPQPMPNRRGTLLTEIPTADRTRLACLFRWVEGERSSRHLTTDLLHQCGKITAHLHEIGRSFPFPAETNDFRKGYRYDQVLARSHRDWIGEHSAEIGSENEALLHRAIDFVVAEMDKVGQNPQNYGIIHSDLHFGNFLVHNGAVSVIDFDQLGRGHYSFDIAVLLTELYDDPDTQPAFWQAFKEGYRTIAPLPFDDDAELNPFLAAGGLAFLDWVYNAPNPQVREEKMKWVPGVYDSIRAQIG